MNGGRRRRFPVTVAACSSIVLLISVVTAQQVFDGNRQPAFVRRQPTFQQQPSQVFPQNRNFILPSASPLRHRNLFTRQISHRHRPRQRSSFITRTTIQPAHLTSTSRRLIPTLSQKRTRSRTTSSSSSRTKPNVTRANANQRTTKIMSNISRRQPQQFQQQRQPFIIQQRPQQFRFQQPTRRVQRIQNFQRFTLQNQQLFTRQGFTRAPFQVRAPLSPMPFGSVQKLPSLSNRRPVASNRLSLRPPSSTPQTLTTTTPLPSSTTISSTPSPPIPTTTEPVSLPLSTTHVATIHSVGGSLRRPIRVQQLQLNLRRKPQMTRGQFRRPQSNSKFPLTRHQPTHRVTKPDRVTRPIVSTTTTEPRTTTAEEITLTVAGTTPEGIQRDSSDDLGKVDDIEAAILQAVIEASSPQPPLSSTHRQRVHRIRPGHRHRPSSAPRVDAIEEAVLKAVLEATPSAPAPEEQTTKAIEETTTTVATTENPTATTTQKSESTSLFPAFATRRHGHRRTLSTTTVNPTTTEAMTTIQTISSTKDPVTTTTTEETTTTSEEPTTTVTEATSTQSATDITIPLPDEGFEDINAKGEVEDHQLHQIEDNVISSISTPTTTISSSPIPPSPLSLFPTSSPSPPSPPAPPREFSNQAGPPGSMPPSDDIVDELNGSSDFLQVAQRLHLLRRLLQ